jgi:hypothetical protein
MKIITEVRHLDGIRVNFGVSNWEYIATAMLKEAQPLPQLIYSNARNIVEQYHYLFDTLWSKAIPAEQRIREIEEGIIRYETKIVQEHEISSRKSSDLMNPLMKCPFAQPL